MQKAGGKGPFQGWKVLWKAKLEKQIWTDSYKKQVVGCAQRVWRARACVRIWVGACVATASCCSNH